MPRRWVMISMFLSSYTPLFVLLGLRSLEDSGWVAAACGVLIVGGAAGTVLLLSSAPRKVSGLYTLGEVERRDGDVAAYAATYLLPFLTVFTASARDVLSLAGFVAFLGFVYVRSRLIYVNPVLLALGWHLWKVIPITDGREAGSAEARWPRYLLADTAELRQGQRIWAHSVTSDLLLYDSKERRSGRDDEEGRPDEEAW